MAGAEKDNSKTGDAALNARRAALAEKLSQKARQASRAAPPESRHDNGRSGQSALAMGFRLSADFLSAVLVGGVLGLLLDKAAGLAPFGLLVFLLLGFAAGVMNILRSLGRATPYGKSKP